MTQSNAEPTPEKPGEPESDRLTSLLTDSGAGRPGQADNGQAQSNRPALAPKVELMGEMKESAFEERQWLVSRDGTFIQVSEPVYRITEQIDGRRTLEEIAQNLSSAGSEPVTPAAVAETINGVLVPAGVVRKPDGAVATPTGGPSALQVNFKMRMLNPRLIDAVTGVLQYLYWPPILIALLVVAGVSQFWVIFVHGFGGGLNDVFYQPGLLLALFGLIVAAAAFHEFGHASALRYGGGKVRGMGAGLYIIYPAFYTDVTDSYRLPRWDRVRTDLGGFYFNIIFAMGLVGAYFATGHEFFLLGVAVVDIEIIHQLLPFIRLDGYWALADLTGIPDFFSRMGPFLRSVLPGWLPLPAGRPMPELKWWAKVVFALYILVTLPFLALVLFALFRALPRVVATAVDAFVQHASNLPDAVSRGDVVLAAGTLVQLVLIALPAFGACYLFVRLILRFLTAVWHWSQPSWPRRLAGATATSLAVLGLVALWLPQVELPAVGRTPRAPEAVARSVTPRFEPIQEDERLTIPDAAANRVVQVPPSQTTQPREQQGGGGPSQDAAGGPESVSTAAPTPPPASTTTPVPVTTPTPVSP